MSKAVDAFVWEDNFQKAAEHLKVQDDPTLRALAPVITSFIGWGHPVREMLDVLVDHKDISPKPGP